MKNLTWLMLVLVVPGFSQTKETRPIVGGPTQQTLGELNGRFWQGIPSGLKSMFIVGFAEGVAFAGPGQLKAFPTVPYGDIVKGLDRFYQEPENLIFPMGYALEIFTMKVRGSILRHRKEADGIQGLYQGQGRGAK